MSSVAIYLHTAEIRESRLLYQGCRKLVNTILRHCNPRPFALCQYRMTRIALTGSSLSTCPCLPRGAFQRFRCHIEHEAHKPLWFSFVHYDWQELHIQITFLTVYGNMLADHWLRRNWRICQRMIFLYIPLTHRNIFRIFYAHLIRRVLEAPLQHS